MATTQTPTQTPDETPIDQTAFWNELIRDVFGPRQGGAIVIIDAENARKGVAKTSAAVALARLLAEAFDYSLCEDDFFLAGPKYVQRYREHPGKGQPSVLVADELVGAGAGDPSRWSSENNRQIRKAFQLLRAKRVITLTTLPDWNDADPKLKKMADYRLWCRERPIGCFQPYKITTPFNSGSNTVNTRSLSRGGQSSQRIHFPNMDAVNDPFYNQLSAKKEQLINSEDWDAASMQGDDAEEEELDREEIERRQAIRYVVKAYQPWNENNDRTYRDVSRAIDFGKTWVSDRVREWKDGQHRDIVSAPEGLNEART